MTYPRAKIACRRVSIMPDGGLFCVCVSARRSRFKKFCKLRAARAGVKTKRGSPFDGLRLTQCPRCDRGQHRRCLRLPHCLAPRRSVNGINKREQGAPRSARAAGGRAPVPPCARLPDRLVSQLARQGAQPRKPRLKARRRRASRTTRRPGRMPMAGPRTMTTTRRRRRRRPATSSQWPDAARRAADPGIVLLAWLHQMCIELAAVDRWGTRRLGA